MLLPKSGYPRRGRELSFEKLSYPLSLASRGHNTTTKSVGTHHIDIFTPFLSFSTGRGVRRRFLLRLLIVLLQTPSDGGLRRDAHPRWGERNFVFWSRAEGAQNPHIVKYRVKSRGPRRMNLR